MIVGLNRPQLEARLLFRPSRTSFGVKATRRNVMETPGSYALREPAEAYGSNFTAENEAPSAQNSLFWMKPVMKQRHSSVRPVTRSYSSEVKATSYGLIASTRRPHALAASH